MQDVYQVIVIGGGHAGVEASWAAANLFGREEGQAAPVGLVTLDPTKIGVMSCNPAIGGLAKGQIVREIDAMGGLMGLAADATGIQFRVLNQSRGPAVRGPRCQSDKHAYARVVRGMIQSRREIDVIAGQVVDFEIVGGRIVGVQIETADGEPQRLRAGAVVLTTGTFMRGLMHTGDTRLPGGRVGEAPASRISQCLERLGFELGRLKTGTPPRLLRSSLDWEALPPQYGDEQPRPFSELNEGVGDRFPQLEQVECRQTHTDPRAHEVIRANLHRAPMYSGEIDAVGPRYCPSIEDKIVRFPQRDSHGVFLEPESLESDTIYANGVSSSLPADVQDIIVRTMAGCEKAEIVQYGYAVEYDCVRPHQIAVTGMTRTVEGLFLAGQINGTSGYEEAAGQGLIAGVNAARLVLGAGEFTLGRDEAYIGVMMDDLVTKTPVEPYRMFTSRAEHRLLLRPDNACDRLTPRAESLGLLASTEQGRARSGLLRERTQELAELRDAIDGIRLEGELLVVALRRPEFTIDHLREVLATHGVRPSRRSLETEFADRKYETYIARQQSEIRRQSEMERRPIPDAFDVQEVGQLRPEARDAIERFRPQTFGQASRLEGITPADMTLLSVLVDRWRASGRGERGAESTLQS